MRFKKTSGFYKTLADADLILNLNFRQKEPQQAYWGLVLANTTSMIGVLRGKICCSSGDPDAAHLHHAFHRLNHIAVDAVAAELVGFGF